MFKNLDLKKYTIIYSIISVSLLISIYLLCSFFISDLDISYSKEIHNEVSEVTDNNSEYEEKVARKGIDNYSVSEYNDSIHNKVVIFKASLIMFVLFILIIIYFISYKYFKKIYKNIENTASKMQKALCNNYSFNDAQYENDSFGVLYLQINEEINTLNEIRKSSCDEKKFLKDTMSDISHQIKTPLASLKIFNELLLSNKLSNKLSNESEKKKIYIECREQIKRIEWMILSMLKLARIESKSIIFIIKKENLYNTIIECINNLKIKINSKNINIILNCSRDITLEYDNKWFQEAIINIINNAIEYVSVGGVIEISVECTSLITSIIIKDNGIGIDDEELPKIFNRFYRGINDVNPNSVGIGLALSKKIIEANGASIKAESKKGEYTKFIISFISL